MALGTALLLFPFVAAPAHAKKSSCQGIKPEQQLETHRQQEIESLLRAGITGLGRAEAGVASSTETDFDTQLLAEDDLARSWYVYQLCVMKDDGVLSATLHDALMRELFGLGQTPAPSTEAGPSSGCPWGLAVDSVVIGGRSVAVNDVGFTVATPADQAEFRDALNLCRKGGALVAFDRWVATWPADRTVAGIDVNKLIGGPGPGESATEMIARKKLKKALEQ